MKGLQLKLEAHLEPKRASMIKLLSQKSCITDIQHVLNRPKKIMKFSRRSLGGANRRDCYNG